jgi:hypothetical protein
MGNQVNKPELKTLTGDEDKILPSTKDDNPDELGHKIMKKIQLLFTVKANIPKVDLAFAISATSQNADRTYRLMKDAIKFIAQEYGTSKIHYGLIVFGDSASIKISFSDVYPTSERLKAFLDNVPRSTGNYSVLCLHMTS